MPEALPRQILYGLMAGFWLLCALVQLNDPDPTRWLLFYGFCIYVTLRAMFRRSAWWFPLLVSLACAVVAFRLLPQRDTSLAFLDDEIGRELLGALLMAGWSLVMAVDLGRGRRVSADPAAD